MLPSITVITPSFNHGRFIERTILSVITQGYPNLEYLVIDGGSTDETLEILQRYTSHLRWWSEADRGQAHALNKGLARAQGEVVAYLNADDEYEPGALLRVGRFFADHPDAMWVSGRCRIIDENGKETLRFVTQYKNALLKIGTLWLLKIVDFISQPSTFWRRRVTQEIGLFDEELRYVMDYEYWLRIWQRYPLYTIDEYLARFRTYPSSKTRQRALLQADEEQLMIKRYSSSPVLLGLHHLHRKINVFAYRLLSR